MTSEMAELAELIAERDDRIAELEARPTSAQCEGTRRALTRVLGELTEARERIAELEAACLRGSQALRNVAVEYISGDICNIYLNEAANLRHVSGR